MIVDSVVEAECDQKLSHDPQGTGPEQYIADLKSFTQSSLLYEKKLILVIVRKSEP